MKKRIEFFVDQYFYALCFSLIGLVYFINIFLDVMDVDAAQYASISREMLQNHSFLEVYHREADYLDKPPLLFWLSALSMFLFGIHNFSYKLPSVFMLVVAIYSTYRFSLLHYNKKTALFAALITASSQAFFLMSNDVRTDGLLSGFALFSVWQIASYLKYSNKTNLILASIGVAGALLTKGPIGLIIPIFAIGGDLLVKRDFRSIFKIQWIYGLLIVLILLIPMCYGLYTQFDLHPEKTVYGLTSPSGLRFFFWTQSFGRITGEIYWDNQTSFGYFFHTILWDFQPWILFFIPTLFFKCIELVKNKFFITSSTEWVTFFGFLLPFLSLSLSKYKLPHYIFPLLPFAAILTADFILKGATEAKKWFLNIQKVQQISLYLFYIILGLLFTYAFKASWLVWVFFIALCFVHILFLRAIHTIDQKIMWSSIFTLFMFQGTLSLYVYPQLMVYQSSNAAGRYIQEHSEPKNPFYYYDVFEHSYDFYAQGIAKHAEINDLSSYPSGTLIYVGEDGKNVILEKDSTFHIAQDYQHYPITRIKLDFGLERSRHTTLQNRYLLVKE